MKTELLLSRDTVFFTTREYALANQQLLAAASRSLMRLYRAGAIQRVTKGIWANTRHPYFTPLGCVPLLLGREQGYVSFLTALHRHGIISQIPPAIQIATTGHTRRLKTPIGDFEFLQLRPQFMKEGIEWSDSRVPYRIATGEKAFLDVIYISTRRGRRFASLPEVDLKLDRKELLRLTKRQFGKGTIRDSVIRRLARYRLG